MSYMLEAESESRADSFFELCAPGIVTLARPVFESFALCFRETRGWSSKAWTIQGMLPWECGC
jgi:hypothetical protein